MTSMLKQGKKVRRKEAKATQNKTTQSEGLGWFFDHRLWSNNGVTVSSIKQVFFT